MANIVLACGGSVAIYKACDLASKLTQKGHKVRTVLTRRAAQLVNPQLFEAVTGEPAFTSEFGRARHAAMDHIDLAKWADLLIVTPASAHLCTRLALGLGSDLVTTMALATSRAKPKLVCPAMNPVMLEAPPVQRALAQLASDGWKVLEPDAGWTACGDVGAGRMPEPERIVAWIETHLAG